MSMITDTIKVKNALSKIGVHVNDIYDLVNSKKPYPEAIPILLDLLKHEILNEKVKEGIIRALAVKEAKGKAGKTLLEVFNSTPSEKLLLRWVIGNTMETVISDDNINDVLYIVQNKSNGMSRQMFVLALGKVKSEKAEKVLIDLLDDQDVVLHAVKALGKLRSLKAKERIQQLLNSSRKEVKIAAQKALEKIG